MTSQVETTRGERADLDRDPLGLTREQIRELGYRTVDMLADQLCNPSLPAMRRGDPAELRAKVSGPPPASPGDWDEVLRQLAPDVLG